jgi:Tol biopolymer transport system component
MTARERRWRAVFVILVGLLIFFIITTAMFPDYFAKIGQRGLGQIFEPGVTPTSVTPILSIKRIEVFVNGSPVEREQLPTLVGDEGAIIEVFVITTDDKTYASDKLKCNWSVSPPDDKDLGLETEQCKTLYIPSGQYAEKRLTLEIEGRERQFKSDTYSLKFKVIPVTVATSPIHTATATATPSLQKPPPTPTPTKPSPTPTSSESTATSPSLTMAPTCTPTLTDTPTPTPTSTPTFTPTPLPLKLAYVMTQGDDHTLYLINLANLAVTGTPEALVLNRAACPAWSPNGRYIAFLGEVGIEYEISDPPGGSGIWRYDLRTNNLELLQEVDRLEYITWSPDNKLIAYESAKDTGKSRIFFMDMSWQNQPRQISGEQPAWSPDNSRLVMKACYSGCGLWTVDLDGGDPQRVTDHQTDSFPDWWGEYIVFTSQKGGNWDIYRVTLDTLGRPTGDPKQLTTDNADDVTPVFSPDGRFIFFRSDRKEEWAIWVMNADGTNQRPLVVTGGSDVWNREKISIVKDID